MSNDDQISAANKWIASLRKPFMAAAFVGLAGISGPAATSEYAQLGKAGSDSQTSSPSASPSPASTTLEACLPHMKTLRQIRGADLQAPLTDPASLSLGLVSASMDGNVQCVDTLLKAGASPNANSGGASAITGMTPLVGAAQIQNLQIVQKLLDAGADPNLRALRGKTASDVGVPPLVAASTSSQVARLLLKAGAEVNAADDNRMTALHWAAISGDLDLVKELVKRGADPTVRDRWENKTPLEKARDKKRTKVVRYLEAK